MYSSSCGHLPGLVFGKQQWNWPIPNAQAANRTLRPRLQHFDLWHPILIRCFKVISSKPFFTTLKMWYLGFRKGYCSHCHVGGERNQWWGFGGGGNRCCSNFYVTLYSFFLWITHFFLLIQKFIQSYSKNIHSKHLFIQKNTQIIHSKNLFIQKNPKLFIQRIHSFKKNPKLFIQRIYSFKKIQNYSFKENIHSSEK